MFGLSLKTLRARDEAISQHLDFNRAIYNHNVAQRRHALKSKRRIVAKRARRTKVARATLRPLLRVARSRRVLAPHSPTI